MPLVAGSQFGYVPAQPAAQGHPLDHMDWNDRIWTPTQQRFLAAAGYAPHNMKVMGHEIIESAERDGGRGAIVEQMNGGFARWSGETDGITNRDYLLVPYRFPAGAFQDPNLEGDARAFVQETMDIVSSQYMNGCIKWVDDTNAQAHSTYIEINDNPNGGCVSMVGHTSQAGQYMNLNPGGGVGTTGCLHHSVVSHEFLHAMGINHEQERPDRDNHVIIHWDNIDPDKHHNFEMMPNDQWFDMGSPYDGKSVMHYSATAFAFDGLLSMTDVNTGLGVQDPRVDRMSSEDAFQLAKMYESFCPSLPTRSCDSGQPYLSNRACDGIVDCNDGSDENQATCDAVCLSPQLFVSHNNCMSNVASFPYLGVYDIMTPEQSVDSSGHPLVIKIGMNDPNAPWYINALTGTLTKSTDPTHQCESAAPTYALAEQDGFYVWPYNSKWYFGQTPCGGSSFMSYEKPNNNNVENFWDVDGPINVEFWSGSAWTASSGFTAEVLPAAYQHETGNFFIYRGAGGQWSVGLGVDNPTHGWLGTAKCPQGTFNPGSGDVKVDYEQGPASHQCGTGTTTTPSGTPPTSPTTPDQTTEPEETTEPFVVETTMETTTWTETPMTSCNQEQEQQCTDICLEMLGEGFYPEGCRCEAFGENSLFCNMCQFGSIYTDPESDVCTDVDECADGSHTCTAGQTCTNTQGGYDCVDATNCCQTMTITDQIPGQGGLAGNYVTLGGPVFNDKELYVREDNQKLLGWYPDFNLWGVTANGGPENSFFALLHLDDEHNTNVCIPKDYTGVLSYYDGQGWVQSSSSNIYCADNGGPDPTDDCPECKIPEGTKCFGNEFSGNDNRIVGGVEADAHSWKWLITMNWGGGYLCGGSIINSEWVLTAAHCCQPAVATNDATIRVGHHNYNGGDVYNVREIHLHPEYQDLGGFDSDICLMRVDPIQFTDNVDIVCLPQQGQHVLPDFKVSKNMNQCYVAGFGTLASGGSLPNKLQSVDVNIYSDQFCRDNANPNTGLGFESPMEFCAGHMDGGKDACQGDSGGPLVCVENGQPVQYGVVSWGMGCAGAGDPGIYAKVSNFMDWMSGVIGGGATTSSTTTTSTTSSTSFEETTETTMTSGTQSTATGSTISFTTLEETTTEPPTTTSEGTTTTADPCPCTDDVNNAINNGLTPFMAKFSQIKHLATGANSIGFAMSQTIHDADLNPGMQSVYDGYLVMRKYASCDASVLEKFADPSVNWYFTDLTCVGCYTTHMGGYYKNDVSNKKKTFTLGFHFNGDLTADTNKQNSVDKYQLFVTGLQGLGVTEQQAYDCVAGAKPANMFNTDGSCDYSDCVGEKILIW